jgi:hypothetical protein
MTEFARVLSTQPPTPSLTPPPPPASVVAAGSEIRVTPEDRIQPVSPKKRTILTALGFFERSYHLASSTAQLAGPPEGNAFLAALRAAVQYLTTLIRWG